MWLMIARFTLLIFVSEQTRLPILRYIVAMGGHLVRLGAMITPRWLNARSHELYLAILLFLTRYYLLPAIANYDVRLVSALPMEANLISLASWLIVWF